MSRETDIVATVRAKHQEEAAVFEHQAGTCCAHCAQDWPCDAEIASREIERERVNVKVALGLRDALAAEVERLGHEVTYWREDSDHHSARADAESSRHRHAVADRNALAVRLAAVRATHNCFSIGCAVCAALDGTPA